MLYLKKGTSSWSSVEPALVSIVDNIVVRLEKILYSSNYNVELKMVFESHQFGLLGYWS